MDTDQPRRQNLEAQRQQAETGREQAEAHREDAEAGRIGAETPAADRGGDPGGTGAHPVTRRKRPANG